MERIAARAPISRQGTEKVFRRRGGAPTIFLAESSSGSVASSARPELLEVPVKGYEYRSDFARQYVAQGREEGRAEGRELGVQLGRELGRTEAYVAAALQIVRVRRIAITADDEARVHNLTYTQLVALLDALAEATATTPLGTLVDQVSQINGSNRA
jgi:hypothetical protein